MTSKPNLTDLELLVAELAPSIPFNDVRASVTKDLGRGYTPKDLYIRDWVTFLSDASDVGLAKGVGVCLAFLYQAERTSTDEATKLRERGASQFDSIRYTINARAKSLDDKTALASAGGKGKSEKFIEVKTKILALLHDLKPNGGWPSKAEAIRMIKPRLDTYTQGNRRILSQENLDKLLRKWLADEPLKSAYEKTKTGGR